MSLSHWFGILELVAVVAFIIFAFRQGTQVKPSGKPERSTIAGETDVSGGGGHGAGGHGGGTGVSSH